MSTVGWLPNLKYCFLPLCVARFARLRSDVLVKLELLDQKHVQDIVFQLQVGEFCTSNECY